MIIVNTRKPTTTPTTMLVIEVVETTSISASHEDIPVEFAAKQTKQTEEPLLG